MSSRVLLLIAFTLHLFFLNGQVALEIQKAINNNDHSAVIGALETKASLSVDEKILYVKTLISVGNVDKANELLMSGSDIPFRVSDQLMNNAAIAAYMHGQAPTTTTLMTPR